MTREEIIKKYFKPNSYGIVTCENCPAFKGNGAKCGVEMVDDKLDCIEHINRTLDKDRMNNPYWENICKLQDRQRKKGIETYGQGLEDNHQPVLVRIQHIEEELIDALMYLEWLKDKLGGMNNG
jgi:uncharacterized protein (DUF2164 family)